MSNLEVDLYDKSIEINNRISDEIITRCRTNETEKIVCEWVDFDNKEILKFSDFFSQHSENLYFNCNRVVNNREDLKVDNFSVFVANDKENKGNIPKIVILMEGEKVFTVDGVVDWSNDKVITSVADEAIKKLLTFPEDDMEAEFWVARIRAMISLNETIEKIECGKKITDDEFLNLLIKPYGYDVPCLVGNDLNRKIVKSIRTLNMENYFNDLTQEIIKDMATKGNVQKSFIKNEEDTGL